MYSEDDTFDVYSAEDGDIENSEAVEMGLSDGELRQSILDRLREDVKKRAIRRLNRNLADYDVSFTHDDVHDEESRNEAIQKIDDLIYAQPVEKLVDGKVWAFKGETVTVKVSS